LFALAEESKPMKRIRQFVLSNLDSLLAISVSLLAAIYGVFGGNQTVLLSAIAGTLGLLAYGIIRDRIARDLLLEKLRALDRDILNIRQINSADRFFSTKTSEILFIEQAKEEVCLVQETGSKVIEENIKTLERLISRGGSVKLIISSSDLSIVELVALRNRNLKAEDILSRQNDAVRKILSLAKAVQGTSGSLEIRRLNYPLDITTVLIDPEATDSKYRMGLIRMVGFRNFFDDKRDFKITYTQDPETFQYFASQFKEMWQLSQKQDIIEPEITT
jgi:hypothetical protein